MAPGILRAADPPKPARDSEEVFSGWVQPLRALLQSLWKRPGSVMAMTR